MQLAIVILRRMRNRAPLFLSLVLLLVIAYGSAAQSGRKPPKPPKSPDPIPSKQEDPPVPQPSEEKSVPKIPVKVGWQLDTVTSSTFYSRSVEEACLQELSRSGSIAPAAGGELNRKKAIDMAKASSDSYVIWFQLEPDPAYSDRFGIGSIPPQYLIIRFDMFSPTTGKSKISGNVYQRAGGPGGLPVPGTRTNNSAQYGLEYAGREMADRVLSSLGVGRPR